MIWLTSAYEFLCLVWIGHWYHEGGKSSRAGVFELVGVDRCVTITLTEETVTRLIKSNTKSNVTYKL